MNKESKSLYKTCLVLIMMSAILVLPSNNGFAAIPDGNPDIDSLYISAIKQFRNGVPQVLTPLGVWIWEFE